jgi:hypothetical protein
MGAGIMLKPNIAPVWVAYFLIKIVNREYRQLGPLLAGTAAGALAAMSFSAVYFGSPSMWLQFAATLPGMTASLYPVSNGNMALPALITEVTGVHLSAVISGVLLIAFAGIIFFTRPAVRSGGAAVSTEKNAGSAGSVVHETFSAAGIGCAAVLLSGNLAWLHYYILLIPLVIYLLRPVSGENRRPPFMQTTVQLAAIAALLLFSTATYFILNNALSQAVAVNIAAAILSLAALYELWSFRERSNAE